MKGMIDEKAYLHKDFFDRTRLAIDNHFYIEAITMEYAAIESRLEAICGYIGFPCGQHCKCRGDIKISSRIECIRGFYRANESLFASSKIPDNMFTSKGILKTWIRDRDALVHGLFKNPLDYQSKIEKNKDISEKGIEYARLLYNEAKRLGRLIKNHPEMFNGIVPQCKNSKCKAFHDN